jgi:hypothetical protein
MSYAVNTHSLDQTRCEPLSDRMRRVRVNFY